MEIEQAILLSDTAIPIYVLHWSPEVQSLMDNLADSKIIDENASSAARGIQFKIVLNKRSTDFVLCLAFINSVSANGYQIVVTTSKPILQQNVAVSTIQVSYMYIYICHLNTFFFINVNIILLGSTNWLWISR